MEKSLKRESLVVRAIGLRRQRPGECRQRDEGANDPSHFGHFASGAGWNMKKTRNTRKTR